jgi:hypothetical protein
MTGRGSASIRCATRKRDVANMNSCAASSGTTGAVNQLGRDIAGGMHKAAQAVGLEEKPTCTSLIRAVTVK